MPPIAYTIGIGLSRAVERSTGEMTWEEGGRMGKRGGQLVSNEGAPRTCTIEMSEHLLRQAPRGNVLTFSGAGNVIAMSPAKGASHSSDVKRGEDLSAPDKRRMTDQIGRQLRGMYDGLLIQPVPDRFAELMQRLEGSDTDRDVERDS